MAPSRRSDLTVRLCAIFFVSGLSALLFETLWFRQAGLVFGNGVWAASLVLSSFMTGLALGNGLAARHGHRIAHPLRAYAAIELAIGAVGIGLVVLLPELSGLLASWLRPLQASPFFLNGLRFVLAFVLLLIPSVGMGATLPLLVSALSSGERDFGRSLGVLYGFNTLGAVAGAVAAELLLVERFGVRGSAGLAAASNVVIALAALALGRVSAASAQVATPPSTAARPARHGAPIGTLAAALGSGFALLALEVVWFRFLLLFIAGTSRSFALMLAVVLAGIGLGSLLAAALDRAWPRAYRAAWLWALLAGITCVATYALFGAALQRHGAGYATGVGETLMLGATLMGPVSFLSGVLFTLLGRAVREAIGDAARATGLLTLANTLGAALGPLVAGLALLPAIGMEKSIFVLSLSYGGVALASARKLEGRPARIVSGVVAAAFLASLFFFPFGRMDESYLATVRERYENRGGKIVAFREGLTETIQYARYDFAGEPLGYQLITNGFSMSATGLIGRRYMELFVHLPAALHADLKDALLISYGVGTTASALVDTKSLERIDVVDISREILEMSEVVHGEQDPLRDSRVTVHVEDGRHFLQTTDRRFDLITGEPPPPKYAGVEYLYTKEYFELARARLNEGGLISYWLPVYQLEPTEFLAVVSGFCEAFEDCSLWNGNGLEWILLGTRGATGPVHPKAFARPWLDDTVGPSLRAIGVEFPEQLGALFIADAPLLRRLSRHTPPLSDDFPLRWGDELVTRTHEVGFYVDLMDARGTRNRFRTSKFIAALWPPPFLRPSLNQFGTQAVINQHFLPLKPLTLTRRLETLDRVLRQTALETLPLWLLGCDEDEVRIAEAVAQRDASPKAEILHRLGARSLARRDFDAAAGHFQRVLDAGSSSANSRLYHAYALAAAGRTEEAAEAERSLTNGRKRGPAELGAWAWLHRRFGY